jgi:hypothetical protein
MDVGMMMIFAAYGWKNIDDDQVWDEELRLARQAADLGFDVLWSAEHHFFDYSFCPDNLQLMTYLAGVCPNIDLGTAAVILPWHDPLRVAEQAAFRFGGIPYDTAEKSLRLFAKEVLPVLQSWTAETIASAAAE